MRGENSPTLVLAYMAAHTVCSVGDQLRFWSLQPSGLRQNVLTDCGRAYAAALRSGEHHASNHEHRAQLWEHHVSQASRGTTRPAMAG